MKRKEPVRAFSAQPIPDLEEASPIQNHHRCHLSAPYTPAMCLCALGSLRATSPFLRLTTASCWQSENKTSPIQCRRFEKWIEFPVAVHFCRQNCRHHRRETVPIR